ncbi:GLPGLI family protein [Arcticibacter tournemirensis]|uniref:GLPGLI family protein n=1 Tax=Arcticibacter tournemirensis TaxID=699437 RepID=A0A4Q0MEI1_9SPHI|nr:GLPGLI family protein [Arcticibacter tournemirensis]RXF71685.1 GLPGLI family protein [Arcticibacter tournemirensis]
MKRIVIIVAAIFVSTSVCAQYARFVTEGTIEFEKSVNMYALIRKNINKDNESFLQPAFEQYRKSQPQFKKLKSNLTFSKDRTLFRPVEETETNAGFFGASPMVSQNNIIYTNLTTASSIAQKKVFEETFLVKDSIRKINWKITTEMRDIAGYQCRRANAIVLDSIYVVAFYAEKIPVSGGPESFTGLPGMILGLALPHENITWFATKVTDQSVPANALTPPAKGKQMNNKQLHETILSALKDWGEYAQTALKAFLL